MTNFKVGQKVVCIDDTWYHDKSNQRSFENDPKLNEICTIHCFDTSRDSFGYLILEGYIYMSEGKTNSYCTDGFRPLEYTTDAIPEILKNFSPKEEISDVPCKEVVNQNKS